MKTPRAPRSAFTLIELLACHAKPQGRSKAQAAFTLIELLAVIAIIGILAALLIPVVSRGVQRGQASSCLGNLKQIGSIMMIYASDHEGVMPVLDKMDRDLHEYAMSRNTGALSWTCPSRKKSLAYVTEPNPINYTGNRNALAWVTNEPPRRISTYQNPGQVLLLADGRENFAWGSWIFVDNVGPDFNYFDAADPMGGAYNSQSWFTGRGYKKTDSLYIATADVDAEGGPSGVRYRHNNNSDTAALFGGGNGAIVAKGKLNKGNFVTAW